MGKMNQKNEDVTSLSSLNYLHLNDSNNNQDYDNASNNTSNNTGSFEEEKNRPVWFDDSVTRHVDQVTDPGGQKLMGEKIDGPEYTSVVGRLIGQRQTPHKNGC